MPRDGEPDCLVMKKKQTHSQTIIGIDLGDKKHAVCVLGKDGEIVSEFSISNREARLEQLARDYPRARVALEVGTHSPWISRLLSEAGMEVFVANARKLRAIYQNDRKCDELDARMLAKIARLDPSMLHPIRHGGEQHQRDLLPIKMRDTLVRQRVAVIGSMRALVKALGLRLDLNHNAASVRRVRATLESESEGGLLAMLEPALQVVETLNQQIALYDARIAETAKQRYPEALKLRSIGGVGPITSLCFVLSIDDPQRFKDARDVGAYLGLVPRRDQSGGSDKQLPISKAGNRYLRKLLVQSAHYILGPFGTDCDLRRHGLKLAQRGGKAAKKRATIAVARKLAVLMLTLWRKQRDYEPLRHAEQTQRAEEPESLAA